MKSIAARSLMVIGLGLVAACSQAADDEGSGARSVPSITAGDVGPLGTSFTTSATRSSVPRDLLVAIAKVEDGLSIPAERPDLDVDNEVPAAGPLQLRRGKLDTLRRGSELVARTEVELRQNADVALEAGALVLAELGGRVGARNDDLATWADAIAEMSGYADGPHRDRYVHKVFATLARGGDFLGRDGEIIHLAPHDLPPSLTLDVDLTVHTLADAQFPGTEFIPTSCANTKCSPTRSGKPVELVIIHDTEGNWEASVATLQNDPGKSAHYIVGEDGKLAQFVTEETTAYHGGNLNYNQRSIGIEHVGYATKPFPEPLYAASAKLVDHLLTKYKLPRDRSHVIGHDQIPNGKRIPQTSAPCATSPKDCQANLNYGGASHHTDPGVWEWATFMPRVNGTAKCNDVTAILNCSNDKKQAFRCVGGKVEVLSCTGPLGCEVKPNGVDDACDTSAKPAEPGAEAPAQAESEKETANPDSTISTQEDKTKGASEDDEATARPKAASSGCSAGPRRTNGSGLGTAAVALAVGLALRTRRRRSAR